MIFFLLGAFVNIFSTLDITCMTHKEPLNQLILDCVTKPDCLYYYLLIFIITIILFKVWNKEYNVYDIKTKSDIKYLLHVFE